MPKTTSRTAPIHRNGQAQTFLPVDEVEIPEWEFDDGPELEVFHAITPTDDIVRSFLNITEADQFCDGFNGSCSSWIQF